MSKQVYIPVCVDEDGHFMIEREGAPWPDSSGSGDNVWNEDAEKWESDSIEGENADLVNAAEAALVAASDVIEKLRTISAQGVRDPRAAIRELLAIAGLEG